MVAGAALAFTAVPAVALRAAARGMRLTRASADDWVAHASLNAIGVSTILHVAIRRPGRSRRVARIAG
jgi:hypothetical protein